MISFKAIPFSFPHDPLTNPCLKELWFLKIVLATFSVNQRLACVEINTGISA